MGLWSSKPEGDPKPKDKNTGAANKSEQIDRTERHTGHLTTADLLLVGGRQHASLDFEGGLGGLACLPNEMLWEVFAYLRVRDVVALSATSKAFFDLTFGVWDRLYEQQRWLDPDSDHRVACCRKRLFVLRYTGAEERCCRISRTIKEVTDKYNAVRAMKEATLLEALREHQRRVRDIRGAILFSAAFLALAALSIFFRPLWFVLFNAPYGIFRAVSGVTGRILFSVLSALRLPHSPFTAVGVLLDWTFFLFCCLCALLALASVYLLLVHHAKASLSSDYFVKLTGLFNEKECDSKLEIEQQRINKKHQPELESLLAQLTAHQRSLRIVLRDLDGRRTPKAAQPLASQAAQPSSCVIL